MRSCYVKILKAEFEARIFVSFSIVLFTGIVSLIFFTDSSSLIVLIGKSIGFTAAFSKTTGFLLLALLMLIVSLLRMWAGSLLTPKRVMTFKVQTDALMKNGPYRLSRNPIYLADLVALTGFAFCFPPIGLVMPILFYFHYRRLILFEEKSLVKNFGESFIRFKNEVPRLFPTPKSLLNFIKAKEKLEITKAGIRHNALYVLFIPGFIAAAITNEFIYAIITGILGVIDWGIVHTKIGVGKTDTSAKRKKNKKVFNDILYSNCWEDPQIDREAFSINSDDVVFSITSGGCNVLTFLLDNPRKVIALDYNPYQNYLLELKISAFKYLNYDTMLELLGVSESNRRIKLFNNFKLNMSEGAQNYWEKNLKKIEKGIINCGRYEKYMGLLRRLLELLEGKKLMRQFFETDDFEKGKKLYEEKWNNRRWKIFTKILLSKKTMSLLFDKAFFQYLSEDFSFGDHFAEKTKTALTKLPIKENYFLSLILLGKYYNEDFLPHYLRKENFETISKNIDRIQIVTGSCEDYFATLPDYSISKFNFTNIFEWIPEDKFKELLVETIRVAKNKSVVTYRNLLVPREHSAALNENISSSRNYARYLHNKDLSFIYNNYVVEQISKTEKQWDMKSKKHQLAEM